MKFKALTTVLTLVAMSFFTFVASGGLSFAGGGSGGYGSLIIDARLAGVGNQDAYATIQVEDTTWDFDGDGVNESLSATCRNRGGNIAPGQGTVNLDVEISEVQLTSSNGSQVMHYELDLIALNAVSSRDANCPNGNWTVESLEGPVRVTLEGWIDNGPSGPSHHDELGATLVLVCLYSDIQQSVDCVEL